MSALLYHFIFSIESHVSSKRCKLGFFDINRSDIFAIPRMFEVYFLTKSLRNTLLDQNSENRAPDVSNEKSGIGDGNHIP